MSHTTFPEDSDITTFVTGAGVIVPSGFSWVGYGVKSQREFERRTRRRPFLKDASDVERSFNPPAMEGSRGISGAVIDLDAGLLSLTSIYMDVTYDNPDGVLLVQGRDFVLTPANAPVIGEPWRYVQLLEPFYIVHQPLYAARQTQSVKVTGRWGYSDEVPEDVWKCCLALGASIAMTSIMEGRNTQAYKSMKTKDEETVYATIAGAGSGWVKDANAVIKDYKLRELGI
jgi:hypothetical protein